MAQFFDVFYFSLKHSPILAQKTNPTPVTGEVAEIFWFLKCVPKFPYGGAAWWQLFSNEKWRSI